MANRRRIAVQLYTLRKEIQTDLPGTLEAIRQIGYEGVELWFPGGAWPEPDSVKQLLQANGLQVAGAHVLFAQLRDSLDEVFAWHVAVGNRNLTIPHIPPKLRQTAEDWRERVQEISEIAQRCSGAGFILSYHNHDIEFIDKIGDEEIQDYIYRSIPADILKAQIDTFFVQRVGKDPADYLRKYAGRMVSIHLKDEAANAPAPVGQGTIDWGRVLEEADRTSAQWYVVEDHCEERDALESVAASYAFLQMKRAH